MLRSGCGRACGDVILGFHDACDCAHEHAALAGQIAVDFILEGCGEQVSGTDGDAECQASLAGAAGGSCSTAKLELMPAPERKLRRSEVPEPLGATMITSTSFGGMTFVWSL